MSASIDWASLEVPRLSFDDVLEALRAIDADPQRAGQNGRSYLARCAHPDHHDDNPSMTVGVGRNGDVVLNCFSCAPPKTDKAARSLWLTECMVRLRDRVPKAPATPRKARGDGSSGAHGSPVAEYVYCDAEGTVVAKKVRLEGDGKRGKTFEWQRPYGAGWATGLGRTPIAALPPYRLPDLLAASPDAVVLVVEGEKDVDLAWSLGVPATSAAGGAKGALPQDVSVLAGRDVLIVADRDKPGADHARAWHERLSGVARRVSIAVARPEHKGADLSDHIDAGHGIDDLVIVPFGEQAQPEQDDDEEHEEGHRRLALVPASRIRPKPVRWLWGGRLARGELGLLAGREGTGKSTIGYWLGARATRGELDGDDKGTPRSVIVAATEDSWEHTIVPRLMAAGADLDRVYRVDVYTAADVLTGLSLPRDLSALERAALEVDASLILLDPLMSRLDSGLDSHKDAEVRLALEPLVALAHRCRASILGLIHFNKSGAADPLNLVMASKAFTAVARSVSVVVPDPDDETDQRRLFGTPKNNLGRTDLPTLTYQIVGWSTVIDGEVIGSGAVNWIGEDARSIRDALQSADEHQNGRSATAEAADWLADYVASKGGRVDSADAKAAGKEAGHSATTLKTAARKRAGLETWTGGFPRRSVWYDPARWYVPDGVALLVERREPQSVGQSVSQSGESCPTGPTGPTGSQSVQSVQSVQSDGTPREAVPLTLDESWEPPPTGWGDWPADSVGEAVAP